MGFNNKNSINYLGKVQTIRQKWKKTLALSSEADVISWRQTSEDAVKVGALEARFFVRIYYKKLWGYSYIHAGAIFSLVARKKPHSSDQHRHSLMRW